MESPPPISESSFRGSARLHTQVPCLEQFQFLVQFFFKAFLGLFWRALTSRLRSMGREDLDSAEQPSEKSELQEPVRGAPGRPVVWGWGCSWSSGDRRISFKGGGKRRRT